MEHSIELDGIVLSRGDDSYLFRASSGGLFILRVRRSFFVSNRLFVRVILLMGMATTLVLPMGVTALLVVLLMVAVEPSSAETLVLLLASQITTLREPLQNLQLKLVTTQS